MKQFISAVSVPNPKAGLLISIRGISSSLIIIFLAASLERDSDAVLHCRILAFA